MENTFLTNKEFAESLGNRQYGMELTKEDNKLAFENGLVVVFGASDDLIEFYGSIDNELSCYNGGYFEIKSKNLKVKEGNKESVNCIYAKWNDEKLNTSWSYETEIPHSKFHIYEDEDLYCVGIVFSIYDLK